MLLQRHAICVTIFVCPILIIRCENSDEYKEVSNRRLTDQIAEKAKQTVVDIGEVMKSQQSVLECDGKKCPNNNIFVFYQCCENVPKECCWHIRYWLTFLLFNYNNSLVLYKELIFSIVLILILLKMLWSGLVWCIRRSCHD
ncbi:unnamed protein product [Wuchereria bancrofti]|uniref:Uncharacterized protein n=1 Tax=Wuchereria bancrofti TaxID=6293 RepID=A0A3P7DHK0_WUCBA|nr:unnamed protein product [Wuchereria bancrofti]